MSGKLEGILTDAHILRFVRHCLEHYQSREEFDALELPKGLTSAEAWELVCFARRASGYVFLADGESSYDPVSTYLCLTKTSQEHLVRIHKLASSDSPLARDAEKYRRSPRLLSIVASDLGAGMERDGVTISPDDILTVLSDTPARDEVVVLKNALTFLMDSSSLSIADCPFDKTGLSNVFERGVDRSAFEGREASPNLSLSMDREPDASFFARLCKGFMRKGSCLAYPEINVLSASETIWEMRPFLRWNGLHEAVFRHLAMREMGLPLLSFVPLSRTRLAWERGQIGNADGAPYPYGKAMFETPFGTDCTLCYQQEILFLEQGLSRIESAIDGCRKRESLLLEGVDTDARLCDRQRRELRRLLEEGGQTDAFSYMHTYGIVSSTAHLDLSKLEDYGYLTSMLIGKRRAFTLAPRMAI